MPVLTVQNITKSYIVDTVIEDISFIVEPGDRIGVVGLNGTGKTTLFQIISGKLSADAGQVIFQKDLKLGYLEQHTKVDSNLSLYDECMSVFNHLIEMENNLRSLEISISENSDPASDELTSLMSEYGYLLDEFTKLNGYGFKSEIRGVLKGLGFAEEDFDKTVSVLSGGQKSRLALAKLLLQNPDILLLDEPTNHLDIDAISWLEKFLRDYKGSSLVISHDRYFLDNVVNRIFFMERKKLYQYNTNYSKFIVQRKKDLDVLKKQYEDQQKDIQRQEEIIQRYIRYGGERYLRQARSRQKMLDRIKLLPKHQELKKASFKFEPNLKSGRDVLSVLNINKSFGTNHLLKDISLTIYNGDKAGLIGPNGIGKTTLFRILLGQLKADSGDINYGHNVRPGYFDQEMSDLSPNKTVIDEVWDTYPKLTYYEIRTYLSRFLFIGDDIFKDIEDLSGGEKARVALLKLMLSGANLLFLDEPTNHLDIDSKEVLEDALRDYGGTVVVISHDRYFLNQVANKIFELSEDGLSEFLGNYDYYAEKKFELEMPEETEEDLKTKTQLRLEKKKEKEILQRERDLKKEILSLEKEISDIETQIELVDIKLSEPETYEDHEMALELSQERENLKLKLDSTYDRWLHINEG
ncbi:MAG: ABC-F family ATP-binding cassette domain-containing protein [Gudongella sp.]|jgi:ATP-binding cassette subfamily F protein 3|nr:ABC-F family ATP-binding cassette domain-containing protein [Gudongella sp.]